MSHPPDPLDDLFSERGRLSAIASEMSPPAPVGTVFSWKEAGNIPKWRRSAVLDAARRLALPLAPETIAYLAGTSPAQSEGATA